MLEGRFPEFTCNRTVPTTVLKDGYKFYLPIPWIKAGVWLLWPTDSGGSDTRWLPRLGHQKQCGFCLVYQPTPLWSLGATMFWENPNQMERSCGGAQSESIPPTELSAKSSIDCQKASNLFDVHSSWAIKWLQLQLTSECSSMRDLKWKSPRRPLPSLPSSMEL